MGKERPNVSPGGIIGETLAAWPIAMGIRQDDPYQIGIGIAMAGIPVAFNYIAQYKFEHAEKRRNLTDNREEGKEPKE